MKKIKKGKYYWVGGGVRKIKMDKFLVIGKDDQGQEYNEIDYAILLPKNKKLKFEFEFISYVDEYSWDDFKIPKKYKDEKIVWVDQSKIIKEVCEKCK